MTPLQSLTVEQLNNFENILKKNKGKLRAERDYFKNRNKIAILVKISRYGF